MNKIKNDDKCLCYTVYKHTSPSNKSYIGITSQKPNKRWQNGRGYICNTYFYRAIQKYGWNNFKHEILFENLSKEEACKKEIDLIMKYNTTDYRYGYNISKGGQLGMSKSVKKYDTDGIFLKQYESLVEAAFWEDIDASCIRACCLGKANSSNGYVWRYADDSFDKYFKNKVTRISKTGKLFANVKNDDYLKHIYKYNKSGDLICIYETVYHIPDLESRHRSNIIRCCNKKIKTSLGFVWRFEVDNNIREDCKRELKKLRKRIVQYDTKGNLIKIWDSLSEAEEKCNATNISAVLNGERHMTGGYVWRYYGDPFEKYPVEKQKSSKPRKYDNMPVYQYDRNMKYIRSYNNVYEIDKNSFQIANVIKCLLHQINYTNGYIFSFERMELVA